MVDIRKRPAAHNIQRRTGMTTSLDRPETIRRDPLTAARTALGEAAMAAAEDTLAWSMSLFTALRKLSKVFEEHVNESEADDGVLPEMLSIKPHLGKRVRTLKQDHDQIRQRLRAAMTAVEEQVCSPEIEVEKLRLLAGIVVHDIRRHETRGNDLLYEALNRVDGFD
jgi:hypothetical protein